MRVSHAHKLSDTVHVEFKYRHPCRAESFFGFRDRRLVPVSQSCKIRSIQDLKVADNGENCITRFQDKYVGKADLRCGGDPR